jgi:hypothetical protein
LSITQASRDSRLVVEVEQLLNELGGTIHSEKTQHGTFKIGLSIPGVFDVAEGYGETFADAFYAAREILDRYQADLAAALLRQMPFTAEQAAG